MFFLKTPPQKNRGLFTGSAAILALILSSCTSTGDGTASLKLNAGTEESIVAEALQSAADETQRDDAIATNDNPPEQKTSNSTVEKPKQEQLADTTLPTDETNQKTVEKPSQLDKKVAEAAPAQKSSLFSIFGKKSDNAQKPESPDSPESPENSENSEGRTTSKNAESKDIAAQGATKGAKSGETTDTAQKPAPETDVIKAASAEKPAEPTSLFGPSKNANAFVTPQRPQQSQGSIARLFNDETSSGSPRTQGKKVAVVRPAPSSRSYNYSLPGVRANAGIEITHRSSLADDSDIDANEYDDYASLQLASAPGLARLAPNGLRVQRETVDVACLKPELVKMLKTIERHFRRPVMVTSGYRSPSYNRKVNGARRSLHMICAAADIQIDGVSKTEIARFARSLPGRGGVGTYCHTRSVHVDIGPERDWNWRCRR